MAFEMTDLMVAQVFSTSSEVNQSSILEFKMKSFMLAKSAFE